MRKLSLCVLMFLFFTAAQAGEGDYAVSKIPAALLKNANSVLRLDQGTFEIISFTKTKLRIHNVVTVLNENADRYATLRVVYDKLSSVEYMDGKLYDAAGKEIRSLKKKDIRDVSVSDGISLMEDNRMKIHDFHCSIYPYTVEYEYEVEYNNTFFFPSWYVQGSSHQSVENSIYTVRSPQSFRYNYKTLNYPGTNPVVTEEKDTRICVWTASNLPAIQPEYATPDMALVTPNIRFSPEQFEIQGYKGSMNTWKEFGQFIAKLNAGRDQLPDNIKAKVHELTDGIADPKEKVRVLYEYLQKNTRYISVQLGIGGIQTFDANYVATKSYGDCKALSNYMYSLLKEAKVKSCYTLVYGGDEDNFYIPDFVYNRFNHIILCVPMQKDTIWLECTNQTLPAGYLGGFTSDRYVMAIDEEGGKLVHTPKYGIRENKQIRNIRASIDAEAGLKLNVNTKYSGVEQDFYQLGVRMAAKDKIKEWLSQRFDLATYDIVNYNYTEQKSMLPVVDEELEIDVKNYATMTGKRLFIAPNILTRHARKLSVDSTRKYDIEFVTESRSIDSVHITLPSGYSPESLPKEVTISSKFGKYTSNVSVNGNTLLYYRSLDKYSGKFPAKEYPELVSFYESVYKADRNKVVLVKNENTAPRGF